MKIQCFVNLCGALASAKKLDWVESLIHPESQICSLFFSLLHIGSLRQASWFMHIGTMNH